MKTRFIGGHVSASGGLDKALERSEDLGANAMQIFSASPRVWKKPALSTIETAEYLAKKSALAFGPVFTHALYLVNLAADEPEQLQKSLDAISFELEFDALIGGSGVVVHLGSHKGKGWNSVKNQVAQAIVTILDKTPLNSTFLIENSAGQKGKLCSDLSEIRWLLDQVDSNRLGVCIDTCHAHTAGYWLGSTESSKPAGLRGFLSEALQEFELWPEIKCFHVNDSKGPFSSGLDRHENIGDGTIGTELFKSFLNNPFLPKEIPLILEVPGIEGGGPDRENVERLKELL